MIHTEYGRFNGDKWEKFCQRCLKIRYREIGYQSVPAAFKGDLGIEGYTRNGLVFQCYCPEEDYDKLYDHHRDKITKDMKKLITYEKQLKKLLNGIKIKKWIFLTPIYRDRRILNHCNKKKNEFRKKEKEHLHKEFDVLIQDIDYFLEEIPIVLKLDDQRINIEVDDVLEKEVEKLIAESKKVDNMARKLKSTFPKSHTRIIIKRISKMVNKKVIEYLKGKKILGKLENSFQELYEKFLRTIDSYESEVEDKCLYPSEDNKQLFDEIKKELEELLEKEFGDTLSYNVIQDLKRQMIADWLMRCPIDFLEEVSENG